MCACMRACISVVDTFSGSRIVVRCNSVVVAVVIAAVCDGYAHAAVSISQLVSE